MQAKPKTHRVTMTPTEYRMWCQYRALPASLRQFTRKWVAVFTRTEKKRLAAD